MSEKRHRLWPELQIDDIAKVVCYPQIDFFELAKRMKELAFLNVRAIELTGSQSIGRARILGKGCVGLVVKAKLGDDTVALKIKRTDANRSDMSHEAEMLLLANSVQVGPKLYADSKNFLAMEFIEGVPLAQWLQRLPLTGSKRRARRTIRTLLEDCHKLDRLRLDHGELSNAPKNVLVDKIEKPRIVDFESASVKRRPSNVTAITQYLILGGGPAKRIRKILKLRRRASMIRALREYKRTYDEASYQRVLETTSA